MARVDFRGHSRWIIRVLAALVIAVAVGYVPYRAYGPEGIGRALRMRREHLQLQTENQNILHDNAVLRQKISRMRSDPKAAARVARDELGWVGPNDIVFQFE